MSRRFELRRRKGVRNRFGKNSFSVPDTFSYLVPSDAPRTITIDDDIIWTDEFLADGLQRTGNGQRTTTEDLKYKWTNPSEIRSREVVARAGGGSDTTTLSIAAGKLGLEVNDLTTVTENLENFGDIITKTYSNAQPDEQIITPGWEVDYDFRTTGKLTETTTSVGSGLQTGQLKRRVERSTPLVGGGFSEHTDTWQRVPVWNTTDTTIVEGTPSGGDKLEHRIGGKFGELVWLGTEGEHFYDEQVQDSYVNGLANELRVGNYRTLPVALESRTGRDDGIFADKLTPLAGAGLVWSETERSGSVFTEYDSAGNLLKAEGLFTHQIESGGDAAAEDYEQATRTFGDWNSQREFERTSNDHFRSFRTRTWTPSVSGEGTVDYQSTDAAFEQKFWGSFGESDTRSVQQGSNWRVPETTLTRSGQYGSGAANPLTRSSSGGHALDSGFYDGGFASWGYEGQAIHTRFDSAIAPGSPQSPSTWDDSTRPDMKAGPKQFDQVNQTVGVMVSVPADIEKRAGELYSYVGYRTRGHYASWYATAAYSFFNPTLAFTTEAGAAFWSGVFRTGKDVSPEFYAVSNGITRVSGAALAFVTLPASAAASSIYTGVVGLWGADQAITGGLEIATGQDRHTVGGQALSYVVGETAGNLVYDFGIPTPAALRSIAGALKNLFRNPSKLVDESINFVDGFAGTNAPIGGAGSTGSRAPHLNGHGFTLREINTVGGTKNCSSCAIATDQLLAGNRVSAIDLPNVRMVLPSDMAKSLGRQWHGSSKGYLGKLMNEKELRAMVPNAGDRGIVYGWRGAGKEAHYFNVVNQNGTIRFLDGQAGTDQNMADGFTHFMFMNTR